MNIFYIFTILIKFFQNYMNITLLMLCYFYVINSQELYNNSNILLYNEVNYYIPEYNISKLNIKLTRILDILYIHIHMPMPIPVPVPVHLHVPII